MSTKIITVAGTTPAESTGADVNKGAPLNAAEFDQNLVNFRAAIDRRALQSSAVAFDCGPITVTTTANIGGGTLVGAQVLTVRRAGGAGALNIGLDDYTGGSQRSVGYFSIGDTTGVLCTHAFYTRNSSATDVLTLKITPTGLDVTGSVTASTGFGCNGKTAQTAVTASADASDLATAQTLVNQIKATLIANGIMV